MKPLRLLLLIALCTTALHAQYKAKRINFKNPGSFKQQQLEDTAGIHPGAAFSTADLSAAAQRLSDSGYFDNVGATLDGTAAATVINFELKPTDRATMVHIGFENFVWLTHDEIEAAIHAKLPLFNDYLTENTPQVDLVATTLKAALATRSIQAALSHETIEPTLAHPERTMEFRVDQPMIRVANIKLTGVTPDLTPLVQKSVNATARTAYNDGLSGRRTADSILAPLLNAGYAAATLTNVTLDPAPAPDGSIALVVSGTLQAGDIYHVSHLTFAGAPLLSAETFASTQKLHDGDLAARSALLETLAPLDAAYRRKGYMDVIVDSNPTPDRTAHQVAYNIIVKPGEQYRIHEVKTTGLDPAAKADFDRGFLLKPGELYSPEYVNDFLKNNSALKALIGYNAGFKAYADPNNHTVDLVMNFYKGSIRQEVTVH